MLETIRLNKVLKELNISIDRAVDFLKEKGVGIERRPTTKITKEVYNTLVSQFQADMNQKAASDEVVLAKIPTEPKPVAKAVVEKKVIEVDVPATESNSITRKTIVEKPVTLGKINLDDIKSNRPSKKTKKEDPKIAEVKKTEPLLQKTEVPAKEDTIPKVPEKKELSPKIQIKQVGVISLEGKEKVAKELPVETPVTPEPTAVSTETKEGEEAAENKDDENIKTQYQKLSGPRLTGEKVDLSKFAKPKKTTTSKEDDIKKKRKRIRKDVRIDSKKPGFAGARGGQKKPETKELTEEQVQKQIKETLEKLTKKGGKKKAAKYRREKRVQRKEDEREAQEIEDKDKSLEVTEFVTVSELSSLMNIPVIEIISACMSLGVMVTMNQRLEADTIQLVTEEFGYEVSFIGTDLAEDVKEIIDKDEDKVHRAPIVTVMGHVDHGKTSLLDYIRETNVIAGESGGITQHIGAYNVKLKGGQEITFLDTPGHEAFTAMRARGAQATDIAIIVAAADDDIMPQTKEAISHAQAAGVPIIFAINKIDKPAANPDKIKEQLSTMNLLVEEWGGKIQSQDISAKLGTNVPELLEKVLLEAELLDLKANPNRLAQGVVIEASLDKGRGYVSTILVQNGSLKVGDYLLAGKNHGKVKAMLDERNQPIKIAGPSVPVTILGLDGAPTAGDKFRVFEDEKEAKNLAGKRGQLQREQTIRTHKHITLDEIGRRIALGDFQELNIILKGDVDGSVEALTDSLQKLSTEEIHVNILHKGVGQITESDVLLASASDAIVIGFNVRPATGARDIADREEIEIRTYSIIYDAINEVKEAMEGMLSPELKEQITGNVEIREIYKISKIGTIAGCMVLNGKVTRNSQVRLIREGVVVFTGKLASLKRFKDDVKEVAKGYECGLNLDGYNDIRVADIIEVFEQIEVGRKI